MCSVHRDPRSPEGVWFCHYTKASGRRVNGSTGTRDQEKAKIICETRQSIESESLESLSVSRAADQIVETMATLFAQVRLSRLGAIAYLIQSGDFLKIGKIYKVGKRLTKRLNEHFTHPSNAIQPSPFCIPQNLAP